jgi:hypothetical protein
MEKTVKEEIAQAKKNQTKSVLNDLNYNHSMLFNKLAEAKNRLNNIALSLGGPYEIERENLNVEGLTNPQNNHISVYQHLLTSTQVILTDIYDDLERLEYLVSE